jgi:hypothetical protein
LEVEKFLFEGGALVSWKLVPWRDPEWELVGVWKWLEEVFEIGALGVLLLVRKEEELIQEMNCCWELDDWSVGEEMEVRLFLKKEQEAEEVEPPLGVEEGDLDSEK